jgi:hypothetical protein
MSRRLSSLVLGVALLSSATPLSAQAPRAERPYRGLFAGGTGDAGQLLTANLSAGAGYDDDLLADAVGQNTSTRSSGAPQSGVLSQMAGSLSYSLQSDRVTFSASAGTSARFYPEGETKFVRGSQGSLSLATGLGAHTQLSVASSISRQPTLFQSLFPAPVDANVPDAQVPNLDLVVGTTPYTAYDASLGISHQLSQRASLSATYSYRTADNLYGDGKFVYQHGGAGVSYSIAKGLNARAGYSYGEANYADGRTRPFHGIDAGVDYNRSLSITRRTTLAFGTGSAATRGDETLHFTFTGSAKLNRELGRTWNLFAAYGRQLLLHETWQEPVIADGISIGFGGLISRRMQFTAVAQGALGTVGVARTSPGFDSGQATASLSYALARFMKVGVTYAYYRHRFDDGAQLPASLPSSFDRHSVRASVSLWAPLVQRARRNNASR